MSGCSFISMQQFSFFSYSLKIHYIFLSLELKLHWKSLICCVRFHFNVHEQSIERFFFAFCCLSQQNVLQIFIVTLKTKKSHEICKFVSLYFVFISVVFTIIDLLNIISSTESTIFQSQFHFYFHFFSDSQRQVTRYHHVCH